MVLAVIGKNNRSNVEILFQSGKRADMFDQMVLDQGAHSALR